MLTWEKQMVIDSRNSFPNDEYWKQFLGGNEEAFVRLYQANADSLFYYGLHFTPLRDQIKDAIQDVFVQLYLKKSSLKDVKNIHFYLLASLKNRLFDMYEKDKKYYHVDTMEPVFSLESSVEDVYISNEEELERKEYFNLLMQELSPRQKEVLYYRFTENMSYEEIGEIMHLNYQSVRNLVFRSIQKIRDGYKKTSNITNKRKRNL